MLWFLLGFLWGIFIAQETPHLPSVRDNALKLKDFILDIFSETNKTHEIPTRTKSE